MSDSLVNSLLMAGKKNEKVLASIDKHLEEQNKTTKKAAQDAKAREREQQQMLARLAGDKKKEGKQPDYTKVLEENNALLKKLLGEQKKGEKGGGNNPLGSVAGGALGGGVAAGALKALGAIPWLALAKGAGALTLMFGALKGLEGLGNFFSGKKDGKQVKTTVSQEMQFGDSADTVAAIQRDREASKKPYRGARGGMSNDYRRSGGNETAMQQGFITPEQQDSQRRVYELLFKDLEDEKNERIKKEATTVRKKPGNRAGAKESIVDEEKKKEIIADYEKKKAGLVKRYEETFGPLNQDIQRRQSGGPITVPGSGSGDKVPMMLPPGSFVLNRNASNFLRRQTGGVVPTMLEPGELVYLNENIPRFQNGGEVTQSSSSASGSGFNPGGATDYKGRPVIFTKAAAESFLEMMNAGGVKGSDVASSQRSASHNAAVGGVPNSAHLYGEAMDIHGASKQWMINNGEKYGWIRNNYMADSWHWDFKGKGSGNTEVSKQGPIDLVLAAGTDDYKNKSAGDDVGKMVTDLKNKNYNVTFIAPAATDVYNPVSASTSEAAEAAGAQVYMPKGFDTNGYHISSGEADSIRGMKPGATVLGDSNAVRISGEGDVSGRTQTGATTKDILGFVKGLSAGEANEDGEKTGSLMGKLGGMALGAIGGATFGAMAASVFSEELEFFKFLGIPPAVLTTLIGTAVGAAGGAGLSVNDLESLTATLSGGNFGGLNGGGDGNSGQMSTSRAGGQNSFSGDSAKSNKPYDIAASIGFSKEDWDIYRNVVGKIESGNKYDIAGGSGGHYDGRWQLGDAAKTDAASYLGEQYAGHGDAARRAFQKDGDMQERYFAAFTAKNHSYLSGNPAYDKLSTREKFQVLGYAHNQGAGGASDWLTTGEVRRDGFGTAATKYSTALAEAYGKQTGGIVGYQKGGMVPTMLEPGEKVFMPGQWNSNIETLNKAVPRFQTGGAVGMTNMMRAGEQRVHDISMDAIENKNADPIMIQVPAVPTESGQVGDGVPALPVMPAGPSVAFLSDVINRTSMGDVFS